MPTPRKHQVSTQITPYYHCVSRCVRRSFLCGVDQNGNNCEHRLRWIEDRILELGQVFAIDICAYAVLSNHYHVVLHIDTEQAWSWTSKEVVARWHQLFKGNSFSQRLMRGQRLDQTELTALNESIEVWRRRLHDISWFMRLLNEPIARQANREDQCTGRFWEGRFKSQALLDEKALIACMVYVDLNPVRAGMAKTPEGSNHTSVKRRCQAVKKAYSPNHQNQQPPALLPLIGNPRQAMPKGLPFRATDYIELVNWTGKIIRQDKRGSIPRDLPTILDRLQIESRHWFYSCTQFESRFKRLVGGLYALKKAALDLGYVRTPGLAQSRFLS